MTARIAVLPDEGRLADDRAIEFVGIVLDRCFKGSAAGALPSHRAPIAPGHQAQTLVMVV
jgi:hypothetical protein